MGITVSSGPNTSGRGGSELLPPGPPELIAGVLSLAAYAALFLWTFGASELTAIRSLPCYSLCISEYHLSAAPSNLACP